MSAKNKIKTRARPNLVFNLFLLMPLLNWQQLFYHISSVQFILWRSSKIDVHVRMQISFYFIFFFSFFWIIVIISIDFNSRVMGQHKIFKRFVFSKFLLISFFFSFFFFLLFLSFLSFLFYFYVVSLSSSLSLLFFSYLFIFFFFILSDPKGFKYSSFVFSIIDADNRLKFCTFLYFFVIFL